MVVPLLLALIAAFLVFVTPGLVLGLDITGGTLIIVQTDQPVDGLVLEEALKNRFSLEELKITTTGLGVRIQFKEDPVFALSQQKLAMAQQLLSTDPAAAKQKAAEIISDLHEFQTEPVDISNQTPIESVQTASAVLQSAKDRFESDLQSTIFSTLGLTPQNALFSKREVGSALGQAFWQNAVSVVAIGLILIAIVIFFFFRELFPTFSILLAAIIDILTALAGMAVLGIPLSLVTLPALLMLIGYAVDTEILLSTHLFKQRDGGSNAERTWTSFKTGMTMTATTLGTLAVMTVISYFSQITVIFEIAAVLLFGLLGDVLTSWLLNAPMLLWHAERKEGVHRR